MPEQPEVAGDGSDSAFHLRVLELAELGVGCASGCLVESAEGVLLAHQLPDGVLPHVLVRSVLSRDLQALDRALTGRRTLGLVSHGPVLVAELAGLRGCVVRLPLKNGSRGLGAVWLLAHEPPVLTVLEALARRAEAVLLSPPTADSAVLRCLEGRDGAWLPDWLAQCGHAWVAAVRGAPRDLSRRLAESDLGSEVCARGPLTYVVVAGRDSTTTPHVKRLLSTAARPGGVGLSRAVAPSELVTARRQAELALDAAVPGECVAVEEARSTLVLRHLAAAVDTLPDLGPDPLAPLRAYDARRDAQLELTLRCWLDSGRDLTLATARLRIHANTLRYRLQRVEQLVGVDLRRDATAALELHVRLHATPQSPEQPQLSRSISSTGS